MVAAAVHGGAKAHQVPGKLIVTERLFKVPLDHSDPSRGTLRIFARSAERYEIPVKTEKDSKQKPWFLFLQGGPGFGCRQPQDVPWCNTIIDKGYKILFLDQRGTGLSSTVTRERLNIVGCQRASEQAAYLKLFRADSIVRDCEAIRKLLTAGYSENEKLSICGQSFGGFCCVTYLSLFPSSVKEVFTMGGLPPLVRHPDQVYTKLFQKVYERNVAYYRKYSEDIKSVKDIVRHIQNKLVLLPSGGTLSVLRLRQLGIQFGLHGGLDEVHNVICRMANDLDYNKDLSRPTLAAFESLIHFDNAPLYALLHEPIYARGSAPQWSADRMMQQDPRFTKISLNGSQPILFTGEMIFRDMFDDFDELASLKTTADMLASDKNWPDLYDEGQLARNEVPVYSITYIDDMYVHFDLAMDTASKIKGCKNVVTNALYHNALDKKSDEVMQQLFALRDDTID